MSIENLIKQLKIAVAQLRVLLTHAKLTIPNLENPEAIVVHYDSGGWSFERVNQYHKERWSFKSSLGYYMGYHYYISRSGEIKQARDDNERGAHCVDPKRPGYWNKNSLGVCLQNKVGQSITKAQKQALKSLLERLRGKYNIPKTEVYGHYQIKPTLCPGTSIKKFLKEYKVS